MDDTWDSGLERSIMIVDEDDHQYETFGDNIQNDGVNVEPNKEVNVQNDGVNVDVIEQDPLWFDDESDGDAEWLIENLNIENDKLLEEDINVSDIESGSDSELDDDFDINLRNLRRKKKAEPYTRKVEFFVGQGFSAREEVRKMIKLHSIESRRDIVLIRNDTVRVRDVCQGKIPSSNNKMRVSESQNDKDVGKRIGRSKRKATSQPVCPWVLHVSTSKNDDTWTVKTCKDTHKCAQTRRVTTCSYIFLAEQLKDTIASNPNIPVNAIQEQLSKKFEVEISEMKCYRAKTLALTQLRGDYAQQYGFLRDYFLELQRTNEDTTVKIEVIPEPNTSNTTRKLKRVYVCIGALKKGFRSCKRDILGLDGSFMKGPFPGQVLTAVGVDPNNNTYPIAYAVVEAENTSSWKWFLDCLGDDLGLTRNSNFTFVSDRQKGIIPAVADMFPNAEHRFCLRHIHENMRQKWKGKSYKDHLWRCATATNVSMFQQAMDALKAYNKDAYTWLTGIPPHHWTRILIV